MSVLIVVGAQWGDEGKGKVVDFLSAQARVVARYNGGANAGHTLVVQGKTLVTHLIPSGVLHPGTLCVLCAGMVIDPATLLDEIGECQQRGLLKDTAELLISAGAHVILPYHKALDELREAGKGAIGTTKRGIGPAYEAKAARRGVRIADLLDRDALAKLVAHNLEDLNPTLVRLGGARFETTAVTDAAFALGKKLKQWVGDASHALQFAIQRGDHVLFEGAQGALLDIDHGTYPFVTSTNAIAGGACTGGGIGPTAIDGVVGITKAYATRVGAGPFPTELAGATGERLRNAGAEFGATTGRPRRCGWLDIPALSQAVRVNGMTQLAVTKLDVLRTMDPIKICVAYRDQRDGCEVENLVDLAHAEPIYENMPGFSEDTRGARSLDELPEAARRYVARVAELAGVPLCLVSVGPGRNETIVLADPFADGA